MQLSHLISLFLLCCFVITTAQVDTSSQSSKPIDANFLFSYYSQDGNNSAVTGGTGTESLKDYSTKIEIFLPIDSSNNFNIEAGMHVYSSASTDNIDNRKSSASAMDIQSSIYLSWQKAAPTATQSWGLTTGGAVESDYISFSLAGNWSWRSLNDNHGLRINARADFDRWILYFPVELRAFSHPEITTDKRNAYSLSWQYDQVLSKRIRAAVFGDFVYQKGLLSTPFHRVFFEGENLARLERFPGERWKIPVGLQLNYFAFDPVILRFYYRFYWDSFELMAHTWSISIPIKISTTFSLSPMFRYHQQDGALYFRPFQEHQDGATYYTSDFDLSTFNSHQYGLLLRWLPFWRLGKHWSLRSISTRFLNYTRTDGLNSWSISTFLSWRF